MDDTNLVRFMQDLVNNPDELRRYKQDPRAYLEDKQLSPAAKAMLAQLSTYHSVLEEVTTVFTLSIPPQPTPSPKQPPPASINLEGQPVTLTAPTAPVIIEATGPDAVDRCSVLPHSYIYVEHIESEPPQKIVFCDLRIAYINPKDTTDYTYVFHIVMGDVPASLESAEHLAENISVSLNLRRPLVLRYNNRITRQLQKHSYYDPAAGSLQLIFA